MKFTRAPGGGRAPGAARLTDEITYLDLAVGRFRLALVARAVLFVQQDVAMRADFTLAGAPVPLCDLAEAFGAGPRASLPFVIVCEAAGRVAAFGVDGVGHLRPREAPKMSRVPSFGLARPAVIAGALRDGERLLMVVEPAALVELAHETARRI